MNPEPYQPLSNYSWTAKWKTPQGRRWLWLLFLERLLRSLPYPNWRGYLLKKAGARLGSQAFVHDVVFQNVYANGFANLELGNKATIQTQCLIDLADRVVLEDEVTVSAGVTLLTHEDCGHKLGKPLAAYFPAKKAPILLKRGCWIGARAVLAAGVTVGECAVVGAASLVLEDVPAWTVVAGVPAKPIRSIREISHGEAAECPLK